MYVYIVKGSPPSNGNYIFNFLKNYHNVFHSSCTILHSHQQRTKVSIFSHLHQHFLRVFSFFLIAAILMSVRYAHSLKLSKPHALHKKMWMEVMCVIPGLTLWQPIHFALTWWWDEASVSRGPWVNGWAEPLAHTFWAQLRLWHSLSSFEDVATRLCSPPLIVVANTITSAALIIKL